MAYMKLCQSLKLGNMEGLTSTILNPSSCIGPSSSPPRISTRICLGQFGVSCGEEALEPTNMQGRAIKRNPFRSDHSQHSKFDADWLGGNMCSQSIYCRAERSHPVPTQKNPSH